MFRKNRSFATSAALVTVLALGIASGVALPASAQFSRHGSGGGHVSSFSSGHVSHGSIPFGHGSSFGGHGSTIFNHGSHFYGHDGFRSRSSFFLGLSFGNYYPFYPYYSYYSPYYDPFYYPIYRTAYVDERPVYIERDSYDRRSPGAVRGDDDYYLYRRPSPLKRDAALADAVSDIEKGFLTDDIALIERHVESGGTISVRSRDRSAKSLKAAEYLEMTRGAVKEMKTVSYKLDSVDLVRDGEARVYGTHTLKMDNGDEKRFEVSFLLKRREDKWWIVEAGAGAVR
jgi:hypothetical protein